MILNSLAELQARRDEAEVGRALTGSRPAERIARVDAVRMP